MTPFSFVQAAITSRRAFNRMTLAALVVLAGMAESARAQGPTPVRMTLDWRFEGPAALFLMAVEKGYFKAEGLDVTLDAGNGSREAVSRLMTGTHDVGFGDVNSLIRYRDENPSVGIKAVMMVYDQSPFAIVGRKSRGVTSDPKSLEGKKLGAPALDGAFAQWPVFKRLNGIDDTGIRLENIGFPVREPMLASGAVDAVFGYAHTSFVNLRARGVPADDIVLMMMADHGVDLYGNAIMVSPKFMEERPEAVRGLLRALVKSVRDTLADPETGTKLVIALNDVSRADIERERLKFLLERSVTTPWVKANGFGGIDRERWERAIDQIALATPIRDRTRASETFTDAFLPALAERRF